MMNKIPVSITSGDDWHPYRMHKYYTPKPQINHVDSRYVADVLTEEEIKKWLSTYSNWQLSDKPQWRLEDQLLYGFENFYWPVIISAPTGKGKNHFILHNLRVFAARENKEILLVSNRVALDYQQKYELAKLCGYHLQYDLDEKWKEKSEFGNVTVLTYHKLAAYMKNTRWCRKFKFVILDECHFFYRDALFNPNTWSLLESIVENFARSVRIYMSGTMEEVYEPIRYFEGLLPMKLFPNDECKSLLNKIDRNPFFYEFARDFSKYDPCFFWEDELKNTSKEENTLLNRICCSNTGKWLIFVTSIEQGRRIEKAILQYIGNGEKRDNNLVAFIDSDSRNASDRAVRDVWDELLEKGTFSSRILITTSVLDNGFSIKDKQLKNIVLFTDDRVEFLQELGRCRLSSDSRVKLYIKIPSKTDIRNWERRYDRYYELVRHVIIDEPYLLDSEITYSLQESFAEFIRNMWYRDCDERKKCLRFSCGQESGTFRLEMNYMVPQCVRKMGEAILKYRNYAKIDEGNAGILFKLEWLNIRSETIENYRAENYLLRNPVREMEEFLKKHENTVFMQDSEEYNRFAVKFTPLYIAIEGTSKISRSKARGHWQYDAMVNRLNDLRKYGIYYDLNGDKKCFTLIKSSGTAE